MRSGVVVVMRRRDGLVRWLLSVVGGFPVGDDAF